MLRLRNFSSPVTSLWNTVTHSSSFTKSNLTNNIRTPVGDCLDTSLSPTSSLSCYLYNAQQKRFFAKRYRNIIQAETKTNLEDTLIEPPKRLTKVAAEVPEVPVSAKSRSKPKTAVPPTSQPITFKWDKETHSLAEDSEPIPAPSKPAMTDLPLDMLALRKRMEQYIELREMEKVDGIFADLDMKNQVTQDIISTYLRRFIVAGDDKGINETLRRAESVLAGKSIKQTVLFHQRFIDDLGTYFPQALRPRLAQYEKEHKISTGAEENRDRREAKRQLVATFLHNFNRIGDVVPAENLFLRVHRQQDLINDAIYKEILTTFSLSKNYQKLKLAFEEMRNLYGAGEEEYKLVLDASVKYGTPEDVETFTTLMSKAGYTPSVNPWMMLLTHENDIDALISKWNQRLASGKDQPTDRDRNEYLEKLADAKRDEEAEKVLETMLDEKGQYSRVSCGQAVSIAFFLW
eukprot:TRINITY_DN5447_c0_g2_i2.p1 TRINITY_DN5447_c0_g2~~TRINITY_DN5447_c0_g2_i2.p1  ORF type:complete len:461 (+),score=85.23 TRINITY_DN5447_c0_g2_i2:166-1548(+)